MNKDFKSGFVSIIGRPNVGKSTLMNALVGEKIAITANRPQTTRNSIKTILTKQDCQIVFVDTPGIHKPSTKLGEYMVKSAYASLKDIDLLLFLTEPGKNMLKKDEEILSDIKKAGVKTILVINKTDTVKKEELLKTIDEYSKEVDFAEVVPISALKEDNLDTLLKCITDLLPEGPMYFPEDMVTDLTERQIVGEIVREKCLYLLKEEIPHGVAVEVTAMKKRENKDFYDIDANIYCEKESHKGIIIGKKGAMLKNIGSTARYAIEKFLGCQINLKLWVKTKKDWKDNDFLLKSFGYDKKEI